MRATLAEKIGLFRFVSPFHHVGHDLWLRTGIDGRPERRGTGGHVDGRRPLATERWIDAARFINPAAL